MIVALFAAAGSENRPWGIQPRCIPSFRNHNYGRVRPLMNALNSALAGLHPAYHQADNSNDNGKWTVQIGRRRRTGSTDSSRQAEAPCRPRIQTP